MIGLRESSVRENSSVERSHGATKQGVPHISLVFREIWDTTELNWHSLERRRMQIGSRSIPHLAKNERDMGHPQVGCRDRIHHGEPLWSA
jgi:hypothetical protein